MPANPVAELEKHIGAHDRLKKFVETVSFPNTQFTVVGLRVYISMEVADSYPPHNVGFIDGGFDIPESILLGDTDAFLTKYFFQHVIEKIVIHEAKEMFRVNGEMVLNPHKFMI